MNENDFTIIKSTSGGKISEIFPNFRRAYARLLEIKELKKGWYNGRGEALTEKAYYEAYLLLCEYSEDELQGVGIYPLYDGGVIIEFNNNERIDIEISPDGTVEEVSIGNAQ